MSYYDWNKWPLAGPTPQWKIWPYVRLVLAAVGFICLMRWALNV